jgi:hypothetical protein
MPLLKPIEPDITEESHNTGLAAFAERAIGFVMPRFALDSAVKKTPAEATPRVGRFYADYSGLTAEEIAATDSECEELFKNSKPVSR